MNVILPATMPPTVSLGNGRWRSTVEWSFRICDMWATVPAGFVCDLFSVPFPLSILIPRDEPDNRPAFIHDWLYATVGMRPHFMSKPLFSREECDAALREACRQARFPARRVWSIYTGVRIGGWVPWSKLDEAGYSIANPKLD